MIEQNDMEASIDASITLTTKLKNIINHLLKKNSNILLISQDAKLANERYLTLTLEAAQSFN